jgi:uncharacterized protein (TIGR04376 family)
VQAAQEREAALLRQGNQIWGQMEGTKKRIIKAQELFRQIQKRKQEVQAKAAAAKAAQVNNSSNWDTAGWNQGINYQNYSPTADPLEQKFQRWELEEELERIKRNL